MPTTRHIEYMPLADVKPAPRNPKGHDEEGIAASIGRHGFVEPILLDERTGLLISGHGRLKELRRMEADGASPPDGVVAEPDGWKLPVIRGWASRSDTEAEAYLIAANQLTTAGGWENPTDLATMLQELQQTADGLLGTGFDADGLDDLLAELGAQVMDPAETDAMHASHTGRGDPAPTREVQGLREVGLMFTAEHHREYQSLLAQLKAVFKEDAAPVVVLRAMREAAHASTG